jgi:hypothetical protein
MGPQNRQKKIGHDEMKIDGSAFMDEIQKGLLS